MKRAAFLKRMALAAAACAFIDVPWPKGDPFILPLGQLPDMDGPTYERWKPMRLESETVFDEEVLNWFRETQFRYMYDNDGNPL